MLFSKALHPSDYQRPALLRHVALFEYLATRMPCRIDHYHRRWEYAMALEFLGTRRVRSVYDIGGGGGLFAALAAVNGMRVTVVDPQANEVMHGAQAEALGVRIGVIGSTVETAARDLKKADAVVALSVIEHVEDDFDFLYFLNQLGDTVFLTTDFHPQGHPDGPSARLSPDHLRCYSGNGLTTLSNQLAYHGLQPIDVTPDSYRETGLHVFDKYNFASLAAAR